MCCLGLIERVFVGAVLMVRKCISCFHSPCLQRCGGRLSLPSLGSESVPAFSQGMLKELYFKGSGCVHVAFGCTSPWFGVEAACVSSWSQEATLAELGLPARIGTQVTPAFPHWSAKHPHLLQSAPQRQLRTAGFHPALASSYLCQFGHVPSPLKAVWAGGCCVPWTMPS